MQRIQAVDRAIVLLKAVAASTTPPTVLELARRCGINRATAWRLLRTLEHHGLVDRDVGHPAVHGRLRRDRGGFGGDRRRADPQGQAAADRPVPAYRRGGHARRREAVQPGVRRPGGAAEHDGAELAGQAAAAARDLGRQGVPGLAGPGRTGRDPAGGPAALHRAHRHRPGAARASSSPRSAGPSSRCATGSTRSSPPGRRRPCSTPGARRSRSSTSGVPRSGTRRGGCARSAGKRCRRRTRSATCSTDRWLSTEGGR